MGTVIQAPPSFLHLSLCTKPCPSSLPPERGPLPEGYTTFPPTTLTSRMWLTVTVLLWWEYLGAQWDGLPRQPCQRMAGQEYLPAGEMAWTGDGTQTEVMAVLEMVYYLLLLTVVVSVSLYSRATDM